MPKNREGRRHQTLTVPYHSSACLDGTAESFPLLEEMTMEAWEPDQTTPQVGVSAEGDGRVATDDLHWIGELREAMDEPGQYLAYRGSDDHVTAFTLEREWTRIGRSLAADVRFDDPTVSRRHALIVRQPDGLRVLDDRSLNGVFVNGERVEWSMLADGDEIVIGRHRLHFCEVPEISELQPVAESADRV
jgi:FHA domain